MTSTYTVADAQARLDEFREKYGEDDMDYKLFRTLLKWSPSPAGQLSIANEICRSNVDPDEGFKLRAQHFRYSIFLPFRGHGGKLATPSRYDTPVESVYLPEEASRGNKFRDLLLTRDNYRDLISGCYDRLHPQAKQLRAAGNVIDIVEAGHILKFHYNHLDTSKNELGKRPLTVPASSPKPKPITSTSPEAENPRKVKRSKGPIKTKPSTATSSKQTQKLSIRNLFRRSPSPSSHPNNPINPLFSIAHRTWNKAHSIPAAASQSTPSKSLNETQDNVVPAAASYFLEPLATDDIRKTKVAKTLTTERVILTREEKKKYAWHALSLFMGDREAMKMVAGPQINRPGNGLLFIGYVHRLFDDLDGCLELDMKEGDQCSTTCHRYTWRVTADAVPPVFADDGKAVDLTPFDSSVEAPSRYLIWVHYLICQVWHESGSAKIHGLEEEEEEADHHGPQLYGDERDEEIEERMYRYLLNVSVPDAVYTEMSLHPSIAV